MENVLYIAALLTVAIGVAHSYLGERYILMRLFRRTDLPELFGGTEFTKQTLRFVWHILTIAWLGFAALLVVLARGQSSSRVIGMIIGCTFLLHFVIALVASRGRHLSWLVFLAIGAAAIYASRLTDGTLG